MKPVDLLTAATLACSFSLSGCCPSIDLFGSTHEVYVMAWAFDSWSSRQLESWNDFVELDHQSTALLVAKVEGVPPLPSGSTGEPEPIEWPVRIEWILLKPQGPGTAVADEDGYTIEQRLAEIRWRIDSTAEAEITEKDWTASSEALLSLIDANDAEHMWIAPGLGAFLQPDGSDHAIRFDLAQQSIADAMPDHDDSPYEPEVILVTPEDEYDYPIHNTIDAHFRYARYVWTTALTLHEFSRDAFVERLEPVRKSSYVFRVKPTR